MRHPVLWAIRGYKQYISPLLPPSCRFYPTCSEYAYEAIARHGLLAGGAKAAWRLLRCNPWNPGGFDPVDTAADLERHERQVAALGASGGVGGFPHPNPPPEGEGASGLRHPSPPGRGAGGGGNPPPRPTHPLKRGPLRRRHGVPEFNIPGWNEFVGLIEGILVFLATSTGSSALAIIILTIAVKLVLVPLTLSSLRSAKKMQEVQPLIKELQKKYGHDRQLLSAETMKLYQDQRVNPFGSCLPLLFQMPIFFALYYAILNIATKPEYAASGFSISFLWVPSIANFDPLYILPVVVTVTQFIQQRMAMPQRTPGQQLDDQARMMNSMMQIMPLMVGFFAWNFAAGPVIYWITQNVFSMVQQYFITGFGSLRDLPRMGGLPVPRWVTPPPPADTGGSKVIVTKSKPGGGRPSGAGASSGTGTSGGNATPPPSGLMGRLYHQVNKRVEEVERQRTGGSAGATPTDGGTPAQPSKPGPGPRPSVINNSNNNGTPTRRSSRRARSK